jgi:hypothetical protein
VITRRSTRFLFPLALVLVTGCPRPAPPPGSQPPQPAAKSDSLPAGVNSKGITVTWQEREGKTGVRRLMDLQAATGKLEKDAQSGTLNRASGVLYKDNKPKVRFSAPVVVAAQDQKSVTATGRVRITSIDPTGVTIEADRVFWKVEQNKIIAEGNIQFTYQPAGQVKPVGWGGPFPRVVMDTELQRLQIQTSTALADAR